MPIYEYRCSNCGNYIEVFTKTYESSTYITCRCGSKAQKIVSLSNTDVKNNERLSSSLGVNPRQIKEAEKKFPGSKYTKDGRLIINSRKDKLNKLKQRGMIELD
jgi:putative FmdB family regulatory protein